MPSLKKDRFLDGVLSYIKFYPDRADIRSELEGHILDKRDDYIREGYDKETAENMSINDMGDTKMIGIELNKQHNPLLGWVWMITNGIVILLIISTIFNIGSIIKNSFSNKNSLTIDIPKSDIVYRMDIDKEVKIDDTVIKFKELIYEENGDMHILYEYYNTKLWGTGWTLGSIGNITDNLGNEYPAMGYSEETGRIKSKGLYRVDNFSKEADTLIINYYNYNRRYRVEIPLKEGADN